MTETYHDRQMAQFRRFMEYVKVDGGVEGPTHLRTMFKPHQMARMAWLKERVQGRILEVGTNIGIILAFVNGHVGLDINPANIELARLLAPEQEFVTGDATKLPFPDKSFESVLIPETLEHLDFPGGVRLAVQEALRVASQRILITMPDGTTDTEDATNFKHLFLATSLEIAQMLSWLPKSTNVCQQYGFWLIQCDLKGDA